MMTDVKLTGTARILRMFLGEKGGWDAGLVAVLYDLFPPLRECIAQEIQFDQRLISESGILPMLFEHDRAPTPLILRLGREAIDENKDFGAIFNVIPAVPALREKAAAALLVHLGGIERFTERKQNRRLLNVIQWCPAHRTKAIDMLIAKADSMTARMRAIMWCEDSIQCMRLAEPILRNWAARSMATKKAAEQKDLVTAWLFFWLREISPDSPLFAHYKEYRIDTRTMLEEMKGFLEDAS